MSKNLVELHSSIHQTSNNYNSTRKPRATDSRRLSTSLKPKEAPVSWTTPHSTLHRWDDSTALRRQASSTPSRRRKYNKQRAQTMRNRVKSIEQALLIMQNWLLRPQRMEEPQKEEQQQEEPTLTLPRIWRRPKECMEEERHLLQQLKIVDQVKTLSWAL